VSGGGLLWPLGSRNLATNPSFETASGTVTVRTNYLPNPRMDNSTTDWTVGGSGITQTAAAGGTRIDFSASTTTQALQFYSGAVPGALGDTFSASIEVSVPLGGISADFQLQMRPYGGSSGDVAGSTVTIAPGETKRVSVAGLTLSGTQTTMRPLLRNFSIIDAGQYVFVRDAIVEKSPVAGTFFSDITPAAGDFSYALGVGGVSIQTAPGVAGLTGASLYQSQEWAISGTKSVYVPVGETGTVTIAAASTAVVTARNSGQTLTVGAATSTSTAADEELRAYGVTTVTLGPGYWDEFAIVEGTFDGPVSSLTLWDWGADGISGRVSVTNSGTADVWPSLTVSGGLAEGFVATNVSTGESIRFVRPIPEGSTVTINQRTGSASIDGQSDVGGFITERGFFAIPAGETHQIQFAGLGAVTGVPQFTVALSPGYL